MLGGRPRLGLPCELRPLGRVKPGSTVGVVESRKERGDCSGEEEEGEPDPAEGRWVVVVSKREDGVVPSAGKC